MYPLRILSLVFELLLPKAVSVNAWVRLALTPCCWLDGRSRLSMPGVIVVSCKGSFWVTSTMLSSYIVTSNEPHGKKKCIFSIHIWQASFSNCFESIEWLTLHICQGTTDWWDCHCIYTYLLDQPMVDTIFLLIIPTFNGWRKCSLVNCGIVPMCTLQIWRFENINVYSQQVFLGWLAYYLRTGMYGTIDLHIMSTG